MKGIYFNLVEFQYNIDIKKIINKWGENPI